MYEAEFSVGNVLESLRYPSLINTIVIEFGKSYGQRFYGRTERAGNPIISIARTRVGRPSNESNR